MTLFSDAVPLLSRSAVALSLFYSQRIFLCACDALSSIPTVLSLRGLAAWKDDHIGVCYWSRRRCQVSPLDDIMLILQRRDTWHLFCPRQLTSLIFLWSFMFGQSWLSQLTVYWGILHVSLPAPPVPPTHIRALEMSSHSWNCSFHETVFRIPAIYLCGWTSTALRYCSRIASFLFTRIIQPWPVCTIYVRCMC